MEDYGATGSYVPLGEIVMVAFTLLCVARPGAGDLQPPAGSDGLRMHHQCCRYLPWSLAAHGLDTRCVAYHLCSLPESLCLGPQW